MSLRTFLQDHPAPLVGSWRVIEWLLLRARRRFAALGLERSSRLVRPIEEPLKRLLFGCRMCGQCVLHETGMTCPMECPKQLRNGPCGGVRLDGSCEVDAGRACVWLAAVERSARTPWAAELHRLQPALDWRLEGMASWVTHALARPGADAAGEGGPRSALEVTLSGRRP